MSRVHTNISQLSIIQFKKRLSLLFFRINHSICHATAQGEELRCNNQVTCIPWYNAFSAGCMSGVINIISPLKPHYRPDRYQLLLLVTFIRLSSIDKAVDNRLTEDCSFQWIDRRSYIHKSMICYHFTKYETRISIRFRFLI